MSNYVKSIQARENQALAMTAAYAAVSLASLLLAVALDNASHGWYTQAFPDTAWRVSPWGGVLKFGSNMMLLPTLAAFVGFLVGLARLRNHQRLQRLVVAPLSCQLWRERLARAEAREAAWKSDDELLMGSTAELSREDHEAFTLANDIDELEADLYCNSGRVTMSDDEEAYEWERLAAMKRRLTELTGREVL